MDIVLTPIEARVLGSLVEKELTTPEYYPLSLNSLTAACNQKNNRDPVMALTEEDVRRAVETLRGKTLAWQLNTAGGRVPKFEHNLPAKFGFTQPEISIVTVLMLRGPLTVGEIRSCTGRMHTFAELADVEAVLTRLSEMENGPYVVRLAREPGRKENRFAHCFCGEVTMAAALNVTQEIPVAAKPQMSDRIDSIENKLSQLTNDLAVLQQAFSDFKKSFE